MALPIERLNLRVIDGGSPTMRVEEAHIEALAFMDECVQSAEAIIAAVTGLLIPSAVAINEAGKIAHRARLAKAEILSLVGGNDAA